MRFFFRKKDQTRPVEVPVEYRIKLSGRSYEELDECDAALKFWLPESVEKKIDEMCSLQDTTASDLVRQILFIHLYGRYDLFGLVERKSYTFQLNQVPRYSLAWSESNTDAPAAPVEKSIADLKVWIPAKMKADIQMLAKKAGKKPSLFVRQVIITHLFGHVPPEGMTIDMHPPDGHQEDAPD